MKEKTSYFGHQELSYTISKLVLSRIGYDENIIKDVCTLIKIHDDKTGTNIDAMKSAI